MPDIAAELREFGATANPGGSFERLPFAAADEIDRLKEAKRKFSLLCDEKGAENVKLRAENERLRALQALLTHADDVVIWEHTSARSGFQEEIEAALGIGAAEQRGSDVDS